MVVLGLATSSLCAGDEKNTEEMRGVLDTLLKQDISDEMMAAVVVEALGRDENADASKFWVTGERSSSVPAGMCVFGSSSELDGWYGRSAYNISGSYAFSRRAANGALLHVSKFVRPSGETHWYVSDLKNLSTNDDDIDYLRTKAPTNASLPPGSRVAWARVEKPAAKATVSKVPFVVAAESGAPCERAQGRDVASVLQALDLEARRKTSALAGASSGADSYDEAWLAAAVMLVATVATVILTFVMLAGRRLLRGLLVRWRWIEDWVDEDERQQAQLLEEDRDDSLGTPPQPRLLVAEGLEEADEDEAYFEEQARRESAGEWRPLLTRDGARRALAAVKELGRRATRAAGGAAASYLMTTVDVTKPLLVLILTTLALAYRKDEGEDAGRKPSEVDGNPTYLAAMALASLALLDGVRRAAMLLFKTARYVGLGRLDDRETQLLSKFLLEECALAAALTFFSVFVVGDAAPPARQPAEAATTLVTAAATLASGGVGLLSRLSRSRLATFVSQPSPPPAAFWRRCSDHARLFGLLAAMQALVVLVARRLVSAAYAERGPLAALQLLALSARASKRTTQALAHHLALGCFELPRALRRASDRLRFTLWGAAGLGGRRRTKPKTDAALGVATYYVEFLTDVVELSIVLLWYAVELVWGASRMTTGSVFFSVFAHQAAARLRARVAFHRKWTRARRDLSSRDLFRPATLPDLQAYDDCCLVCMDDLRPDDTADDADQGGEGGRDDRARLPVRLNCGHILHLGCLQLYVDTSHTRASERIDCPKCRAPLSSAPPEPRSSPHHVSEAPAAAAPAEAAEGE